MSGKDSKGATEEVIEEINVEDGSDPAYQLDPGTNRSHPVNRYSIIGGAYTAQSPAYLAAVCSART